MTRRLGIIATLLAVFALASGCGPQESELRSGSYVARVDPDKELAGLTMVVDRDAARVTLSGGPLSATISLELTSTPPERWPTRCPMSMKSSKNEIATLGEAPLTLGSLLIPRPALMADCYDGPDVILTSWPHDPEIDGRRLGVPFVPSDAGE